MVPLYLVLFASVVSLDMEKKLVEVIPVAQKAVVFIGGGSGVIISPDGLVLTCNHVVVFKNKWEVNITGGQAFSATVIGRQPEADIAVMKLQGAKGLPFLSLAVPETVMLGDTVLALGNPFLIGTNNPHFLPLPPEFIPSVSCGVITRLHRFNQLFSDFLECDTPINPGNSGGPIINAKGEIVGLSSRIASRFGIRASTGVGYAPSCGLIRRLLPFLVKAGGKTLVPGTLHGIKVKRQQPGKIVVDSISDAASKDVKLFKPGDVIISVGGLRVRSPQHFFSALATFVVGQEAVCWVKRNNKDLLLKVKLETRSRDVASLGIKAVDSLEGLKITGVTEPAKKAGLAPGDILLTLNNLPIQSAQELSMFLLTMNPRMQVTVTVRRNGEIKSFHLRLGKVERNKQGRPFL